MKTTLAIILALFLAGCSSPKPPPSGYDQDTTPGDDGSTYGGYLDPDTDR